MIIVKTLSSKYFELNGIQFAKIYQPLKQGLESVGIYSIYDTRLQIQNSERFDAYQINDTIYGSQEETIAALLDVVLSLEGDTGGTPIEDFNTVVRASWIPPTGFVFDCAGYNVPISGYLYDGLASYVTLDAPETTAGVWRTDLIGMFKPVAPETKGVFGFIKGTPTAGELVSPPDYDPSEFYLIKPILVKDNAAEPSDPDTGEDLVVKTMYAEDAAGEWATSSLEGSNDFQYTVNPYLGTYCIRQLLNGVVSKFRLTSPELIDPSTIGELSFYFRLSEASAGKYFYVKWLDSNYDEIGTSIYAAGSYGTDGNSFDWQRMAISRTELNLSATSIKGVEIYFYNTDGTYIYFDNITLGIGNSVIIPTSGIEEAPIDGKEYNRKDGGWTENVGGGVGVNSVGYSELKESFKTIIDLGDVSGTVNLDWSLAVQYKLNMIGNTTLTFSNVSNYAGVKTQLLQLTSNSDTYTLTNPTGVNVVNDLDGIDLTLINHITYFCHRFTGTPFYQSSVKTE